MPAPLIAWYELIATEVSPNAWASGAIAMVNGMVVQLGLATRRVASVTTPQLTPAETSGTSGSIR